jgi:hypothetical protein
MVLYRSHTNTARCNAPTRGYNSFSHCTVSSSGHTPLTQLLPLSHRHLQPQLLPLCSICWNGKFSINVWEIGANKHCRFCIASPLSLPLPVEYRYVNSYIVTAYESVRSGSLGWRDSLETAPIANHVDATWYRRLVVHYARIYWDGVSRFGLRPRNNAPCVATSERVNGSSRNPPQ